MSKKGIIFLALTVLVFGGVTIYYNFFSSGETETKKGVNRPPIQIKPKLKIIDETSNTRPIAVMINNNTAAWKNHSGLSDAYLVYEAITEGGITRLMAIYKDQSTERIGSVRSSRHYFLDYALENDAIYAHFGWSPQAQNDIASLGIQNINGIYDGNAYFRDKTLNVAYEHTAYTSMDRLKESAKNKNYRMTTDKELLLQYSVKEIGLQDKEGSIPASNVIIPYSRSHTTSYTYDPASKKYLRYMNDIPHTDGVTKEQYSTKNIIIVLVSNYSMDNYGRQNINNIGSGKGYYITGGNAIEIQWQKSNRSAQTKYTYLDGTEITVNDGNTFIQIEPSNMTPTFSA